MSSPLVRPLLAALLTAACVLSLTGPTSAAASPDDDERAGEVAEDPSVGDMSGEAADGAVTGEAADDAVPGAPGPDGAASDGAADLATAGTDGGATVTTQSTRSTPATVGPLRPRAPVVRAATTPPAVVMRGSGWGHGVGMSQFGAYAMALDGRSVDEILTHYYRGTALHTDDRTNRRIRVGLAQDRPNTVVQLLAGGAPVEWRACSPAAGATTDQRIAADGCVPLFVQQPATSLRVCPDGVGLKVVAVDAPLGCAERTPLHVTDRPVLRVDHHGSTIRALTTAPTATRYQHGYHDIRVKVGGTVDVVQDVDSVERYLQGLAEVPSSWGERGPAALDAQAVTGRTYALRFATTPQRATCMCDLLNTPRDQVYTGREKALAAHGDRWVAAVQRTAGRVLTFTGADGVRRLAETYYSSSHGGRSENIEDSWAYGTTVVPYLRSVDDPWSLDPRVENSRAAWTATTANATMAAFVSTGRTPALRTVERMRVLSRTEGGTPRTVEVTGTTTTGVRTTFEFSGRPGDAKPIAGASLRRFLTLQSGGTSDRLNSSQLTSFTFAPFVDDDGSVHEFAISWAATGGIVQGVGGDRYAPDRAVTRAQMATFLFNTYDIPPAPSTGRFSDVTVGATHAAAIEAVAAIGLAGGYPNGTYRPEQPVTRAQMATFLARAQGLSATPANRFVDVPTSMIHADAIEAVAQAGITQGCTPDRFCPAEPVTRGQLASFLRRAVVG